MPRRPKGSPKPIAKTAARMSRRAALTPDQLKKLDAYWRASNYLAACQLYLLDNPLLKEPLEPAHIKKVPSLARTSSIHTSTASSTGTT